VQKRIAVVVVTLAFLVVGSVARTQSSDPWIGTWKVNLEKSTYSPGPKPTVAATVKSEPSAGGLKTTIDATNAEGKPIHTESVAKFDGKDYPVTGAQAPNTTNALKRIDDRTFEVMGKVDGKPALTTRVAVAADGKTMTATQTGTNAQGQSVNNVIVLNKQ
jgi:formylglycine-generating enzyme required for sulfatase activity